MAHKGFYTYIHGRRVWHPASDGLTNGQRIQRYFDGIKRIENAAYAEAYAKEVAIEREQTEQLLALVIAQRPALDRNIRASVMAIYKSANLPRASVDSAINQYKDYVWDGGNNA